MAVYVNVDTKKFVCSDSFITPADNNQRPALNEGTTEILDFNLVRNDGSVYPLAEGDTLELAGDVDFKHVSDSGSLADTVTGTVASITLTGLETPPEDTGHLLFNNRCARVEYTAVVASGANWIFSVDHDFGSDSYDTGDTVEIEDPLMTYSGPEQFNISGDRSDLGIAQGKISARVHGKAPAFGRKLETESETDGEREINMSLILYKNGSTEGIPLLRDTCTAYAAIKTTEGMPGSSDPLFYTASQVNTLLADYYTSVQADSLLSGYALSNHNHDSAYSAVDHNHDTTYSQLGHTHTISQVTDLQTTLDGKANATHTHEISEVTDLQASLDTKESTANKGIANGYAELDDTGKVPFEQLPDVNENLLINGDFQVWQRGESFVSPAVGDYTADRWEYIGNTNVNVDKTTDGIKLLVNETGSSKYHHLWQLIEDYKNLAGKSVTFSAKIRTNITGKIILHLYDGVATTATSSAASDEAWQVISSTMEISNTPTNDFRIGINGGTSSSSVTAGDYFEVDWIKLEYGSEATEFRPKSYAEELRDCQRYFNKLGGNLKSIAIRGYQEATKDIYQTLTFPEMRTTPTATFEGEWISSNVNTMSIIASSKQTATIRVQAVATGEIFIETNNNGYLTLDAEL